MMNRPRKLRNHGSWRHTVVVRVTHWITVISFVALLVTCVEILISHPRFYWGEVGNSLNPPRFQIPISSSRATVPTGYGYVLPDQNGWSRYLHFQGAWALVLMGPGLRYLWSLDPPLPIQPISSASGQEVASIPPRGLEARSPGTA